MKKLIQSGFLAVMLLAPAWAENAMLDFQLFNRTEVNIKKIFISPSNAEHWQEDLLGGRMLVNGGDLLIQFHPDAEAELWDIRVEDSDGGSLNFQDVDLTTTEKVILNPDHTATVK